MLASQTQQQQHQRAIHAVRRTQQASCVLGCCLRPVTGIRCGLHDGAKAGTRPQYCSRNGCWCPCISTSPLQQSQAAMYAESNTLYACVVFVASSAMLASCQLRDGTPSMVALHPFVSHAGRHHAKHR